MHGTLARIVEECAKLDDLPDALDIESMPAEDAFRVALGPLADTYLPPPVDADAVEILGWLELPLDDAPALVVTLFNEGFVPQSAGSDAFLPDRLRRELGLLHNERRYARDAYASCVLTHSRSELRVLFARHDTANNPLQPSRLLFTCPDDVLVRRALKFFGPNLDPKVSRPLWLVPTGATVAKSRFERPAPFPCGKKRDSISVSTFKNYLACPYRFYLRYVRKLEAIDDSGRELEANHFGQILHRVLSAFGRDSSGACKSERADDIYADLHERLNQLAKDLYGGDMRRPALRLQFEQARQRLKSFADCQANHVRDGWRILFAEDDAEDGLAITFSLVEEPITLKGRIDRIDFHEAKNAILVLDYKTGDKGMEPDKTHRRQGTWLDLQLPLYRHLWSALDLRVPVDCEIQLAYFNLPKQARDTGIKQADWDEALLAEADAEACRVIRACARKSMTRLRRHRRHIAMTWPAFASTGCMMPPMSPMTRARMTHERIILGASGNQRFGGQRQNSPADQSLSRPVGGRGEVNSILATTFTRKAAGEIVRRVLTRLAGAAADPGKAMELAHSLQAVGTAPPDFASLLRSLLGNLHRLRIGTLDSFAMALAGSFSLELGLPSHWAICDEVDNAALYDDALEHVFAQQSSAIGTLLPLLSKGETTRTVFSNLRDIVQSHYEIYGDSERSAWEGIEIPSAVPEADRRLAP